MTKAAECKLCRYEDARSCARERLEVFAKQHGQDVNELQRVVERRCDCPCHPEEAAW